MSKIADLLTAGLGRASDILFVQNPRGSSLGAFFGVTLDGAIHLFSPFLRRFTDYVAPERVNILYCMAFGIFLFNIPLLFKGRDLPKEVADAIEAIRQGKKAGLPDLQVKLQWLALCRAVLERVAAPAEPSSSASPSQLRERS